MIKMGIFGSARSENEKRVAVHPEQLPAIIPPLRQQLWFEAGYGEPFGMSDSDLANFTGGVLSRLELIETVDLVVIPRITAKALQALKSGQTVWGWANFDRNPELTQVAIDRHLTVLTWESLNLWTPGGDLKSHVFYKSNEIAGFTAVLEACRARGVLGSYGRQQSVAVMGQGSTARGAIRALHALGFNVIRQYVTQPPQQIAHAIPGIPMARILPGDDNRLDIQYPEGYREALIDVLAETDIIVNCVRPDFKSPLTFVHDDELPELAPGTLIVDVYPAPGSGFPFAHPADSSQPSQIINGIWYFSNPDTPSHYWDSATWEISQNILSYLQDVLDGPKAWAANPTLSRSLEIQDGMIRNKSILFHQNRSSLYPHLIQD